MIIHEALLYAKAEMKHTEALESWKPGTEHCKKNGIDNAIHWTGVTWCENGFIYTL